MIANITRGGGFRGVLEYVFDPQGADRARFLGGTMLGTNPRELSREFGSLRAMRPDVKNPVKHISFRCAPGETLSDDHLLELARRKAEIEGWDSWCVVRHTDKLEDHGHMIASRITSDGRVIREASWEYERTQKMLRDFESEHGFREVESTPDLRQRRLGVGVEPRKKATRDEAEMVKRTKTPSLKQQLQDHVLQAMERATSVAQFEGSLRAAGVDVQTTAKGGRMQGFAFGLGDFKAKGSALGKAYSAAAILKRIKKNAAQEGTTYGFTITAARCQPGAFDYVTDSDLRSDSFDFVTAPDLRSHAFPLDTTAEHPDHLDRVDLAPGSAPGFTPEVGGRVERYAGAGGVTGTRGWLGQGGPGDIPAISGLPDLLPQCGDEAEPVRDGSQTGHPDNEGVAHSAVGALVDRADGAGTRVAGGSPGLGAENEWDPGQGRGPGAPEPVRCDGGDPGRDAGRVADLGSAGRGCVYSPAPDPAAVEALAEDLHLDLGMDVWRNLTAARQDEEVILPNEQVYAAWFPPTPPTKLPSEVERHAAEVARLCPEIAAVDSEIQIADAEDLVREVYNLPARPDGGTWAERQQLLVVDGARALWARIQAAVVQGAGRLGAVVARLRGIGGPDLTPLDARRTLQEGTWEDHNAAQVNREPGAESPRRPRPSRGIGGGSVPAEDLSTFDAPDLDSEQASDADRAAVLRVEGRHLQRVERLEGLFNRLGRVGEALERKQRLSLDPQGLCFELEEVDSSLGPLPPLPGFESTPKPTGWAEEVLARVKAGLEPLAAMAKGLRGEPTIEKAQSIEPVVRKR